MIASSISMLSEVTFAEVCRAADPVKAVAELNTAQLRSLLEWLISQGKVGGIPGEIWGICLVEATKRWMEK